MKASIAFFMSSLVTKGIAYIVTPIYTRLLSPIEYGQTSVFLTWLNLFGIIAMFCLYCGVFNNGMIDYPERRNEYSFSMLIFSNIITICFSVILFCVYPLCKELIGIDWHLLVLMCILFVFHPAYSFWTARQRYEVKYKYTVLWTIISALLSPVVAIISILIFDENRLYARIFGAEIPLLIIYIGFYIYLGIKSQWKIDTSYWKAAFLFNLPLIPHYLSTYLLGSSDKLMISRLVSDEATAYYSVAYSVASVVTIVWSSINSSLIPYTYENCKKKDYDAISKITMPILTMFAAICALVIMLAPEVVAVMATKDYVEAIYVIPPIVGGVFFQVQYYIYANIVYYYKKPKYVMFASVGATVLNIILNYIFIPIYGYIAAGYTTLICYLFQASMDYFALKKVVDEQVYDMRYIGVLSLIMILVALLSNLIYDWAIIRYAIVVIVVLLCICFRKNIMKMFLNLKKGKK